MIDTFLRHGLQTLSTWGWSGSPPALLVDGERQRLFCLEGETLLGEWVVSTGITGFGCLKDSGKTPTGLHRIHTIIGGDAPLGSVFKGREPTGEIVPFLDSPQGDWITTRILWLEGMEEGCNQGGDLDTFSRYIYIHGTPYTTTLGSPVSAGCIRMAGQEIIRLAAMVQVGTLVLIIPPAPTAPAS